jgi:hypothetical protein
MASASSAETVVVYGALARAASVLIRVSSESGRNRLHARSSSARSASSSALPVASAAGSVTTSWTRNPSARHDAEDVGSAIAYPPTWPARRRTSRWAPACRWSCCCYCCLSCCWCRCSRCAWSQVGRPRRPPPPRRSRARRSRSRRSAGAVRGPARRWPARWCFATLACSYVENDTSPECRTPTNLSRPYEPAPTEPATTVAREALACPPSRESRPPGRPDSTAGRTYRICRPVGRASNVFVRLPTRIQPSNVVGRRTKQEPTRWPARQRWINRAREWGQREWGQREWGQREWG